MATQASNSNIYCGKSALTQFVSTIIGQCEALDTALNADAEAMRILLGGPEARVQAEQEYAEQKRYETETGIPARRAFDERDKKRTEWLGGAHKFSFAPAPSRVQELLGQWGQRDGYAVSDRLFQAALEESRNDGTAKLTGEELKAALVAHKELLDVAGRLTEDDSRASSDHPDWNTARQHLESAAGELAKYCPPVQQPKAGAQVSQRVVTTYLPAELCIALGISNRTLNGYAKQAGVQTPGRGKRNHRYSQADREAICRWVVAKVSDATVVDRAREIIREIETKSKNGK